MKRLSYTRLGEDLLDLINGDLRLVVDNFPYYDFNPYISLFFDIVYDLDLNNLVYELNSGLVANVGVAASTLQHAVDELRRKAGGAVFKNRLKNYRRTALKNSKEVASYINSLFAVHSKLMVVRLDVGYMQRMSALDEYKDVEYERVSNDRIALFRILNKVAKDSLVGFIWKLEYGLGKSFHYHLMLFFDGSKVREDVTWGRMVGQMWVNEVTGREGVYWNCNKDKESYKRLGIGMIEYHEEVKRSNLETSAQYLTKPDYYVRMKLPGNARAMGKGLAPKLPGKKRGRPRLVYSQA